MKRWAGLVVGVVAWTACADSTVARRFFADCSLDEQCASGVCFQGSCSKPCTTSDACEGGACVTNFCLPLTKACDDQDVCTTDSWGDDGQCTHTAAAVAGCQPVKKVFLTSQSFSANLGGLAGADAICQKLGATLAPSATFKAWLSSTQAAPADRFSAMARGPQTRYVLPDGTVVAEGWAELTSGQLRHPIDQTELGKPHPGGTNGCKGQSEPSVWTATLSNGTADGDRTSKGCSDWTVGALAANAQAIWGKAASTTEWSTNATCNNFGANTCNRKAALYCFEQ